MINIDDTIKFNLPTSSMTVQSLFILQDIERDLECACVDDWKSGECGEEFINAYKCYMKSDTTVKGQDCVNVYAALQRCIVNAADLMPEPEPITE